MYPRVAVTGLGVFCAAGKNIADYRRSVLHGLGAIGAVDLFDVTDFQSKIAAQVRDYDPGLYFSSRRDRSLSRTDQFALLAAEEAIALSGVTGLYDPYECGVSVGGGAAGMLQAEQWLAGHLENSKKRQPRLLAGVLPDRTATELARRFRFAGYQGSITTACSSSSTAIGWGADLIRSGRQKAMLCGGADSLTILTYAGFNSLKVVDPEPCAPFSLGRQGISLGEGAAFMLLESEPDAVRRGAGILGYIAGYSLAGEAYHMTAPDPDGASAARVMLDAVSDARCEPDQIGWVNAHGTGTPLNDAVESQAMKKVFGQRVTDVPLVSTKPVTGHCLGAAGAIEAVATLLALDAGTIPQTLNFRGHDPACDLDYCHAGSRNTGCKLALSNSFAFGGNITTLVLAASGWRGK